MLVNNPDNKIHGANMGPTWVLSAPDGPHVGPMNLAIREGSLPVSSLLQWHNMESSLMGIHHHDCWAHFSMRATLVIPEMPQGGTLIYSPLPCIMMHQWSLLLGGCMGNKHWVGSYEWYLWLSVQNVWYLIEFDSQYIVISIQLIKKQFILNKLRPRQNRWHFANNIFKCIFLNEIVVFRLELHWNLFPSVQLTFQYWFR